MSSSSPIPISLPAGKDPPSNLEVTSSPPSPAPSTNPSLIPPSTFRPSPLRNNTSDSFQQQAQASIDEAVPRRAFSPFFTLVHDPTTNSTHHPSRIHYIFSDDDETGLSAACIRALDVAATESPSTSQHSQDKPLQSSSTSSSSSATFRKDSKPQIKGKEASKREERIIIVDINDAGDGVTSASSLSEKWQVLNAEVGSAPTYDVGESENEGDGNGLMLRIEGIGSQATFAADDAVGLGLGKMTESKEYRRKSGETEQDEDHEMHALLDGFDQKMAMLRKIVAAGASLVSDTGEHEEVTEP